MTDKIRNALKGGGWLKWLCAAVMAAGVCLLFALMSKHRVSLQTVDGHEYVDLGLPSGTLWATHNVGAIKAYETGYRFEWAETEPRNNENLDRPYKWGVENKKVGFVDYLIKYNVNFMGLVDSLLRLDPADDAVTANWGENWRMPTWREQKELAEGCKWEWRDLGDDVQGYLGVSLKNGKTIFFPTEDDCVRVSEEYYWSSTLFYGSSDEAFALHLKSEYANYGGVDSVYSDHIYRQYNGCVRAVVKR